MLSGIIWLLNAVRLSVLQVAVQSLWNMRLVVLVKPEHEGRISHVNTASVKTGLGNTLGELPFLHAISISTSAHNN